MRRIRIFAAFFNSSLDLKGGAMIKISIINDQNKLQRFNQQFKNDPKIIFPWRATRLDSGRRVALCLFAGTSSSLSSLWSARSGISAYPAGVAWKGGGKHWTLFEPLKYNQYPLDLKNSTNFKKWHDYDNHLAWESSIRGAAGSKGSSFRQ